MLNILHTKINRKTPALRKCIVGHMLLQLHTDILGHLCTEWMPEGMGHIFEIDPPKIPLLLYSVISCLPWTFSHHFSSQMPCLFCPSRLVISFWDFYRPYHSPVSYVLYLDKVLPKTANPFDAPHSAYSCSPKALKSPY